MSREERAVTEQSQEERVHHPWFARAYMKSSSGAEDEYRRELLAGLTGEVIEVGAGHGLNFAFYPGTVTRVLAVEPESLLRDAAEEAARLAVVPVDVIDGVASRLPAADASFDAAVISLVLCSVPDQGRALAELMRVIRPGGELRFYEHVASASGLVRGIQRAADATVWPRLAGNCHMARDTERAIRAAGFEIESNRRFSFPPRPVSPPIPHILGRARRP